MTPRVHAREHNALLASRYAWSPWLVPVLVAAGSRATAPRGRRLRAGGWAAATTGWTPERSRHGRARCRLHLQGTRHRANARVRCRPCGQRPFAGRGRETPARRSASNSMRASGTPTMRMLPGRRALPKRSRAYWPHNEKRQFTKRVPRRWNNSWSACTPSSKLPWLSRRLPCSRPRSVQYAPIVDAALWASPHRLNGTPTVRRRRSPRQKP